MANLRVGLTGGIGSGKSTVAQMLSALGALIVDTDGISRDLTGPGGHAVPAIRDGFGAEFIDPNGALDRARMRELVFRQPAARQRLEQLLHPLIGAETVRRAALASPGQPVVFDVPLLVESGRWRTLVDRVLVIDCRAATQVERVMRRSQLSAEEVERIIAQQAPRALRLAAADAVVFNDGLSVAELQAEVQDLWNLWRATGP